MSANSLSQHFALTQVSKDLTSALKVDWDGLEPEELPAQAELVLSIHAKIEALVAKVIAGFDRSGIWAEQHRTPAALLSKLVPNRRRPVLNRAIRHGDRLRQMPHTADAFELGEITTDHVRLLTTLLHSRFENAFLDAEEVLVGYAKELSWNNFVRIVSRWKDAADRSEPDERDEQDLDARAVHLARSFNDRGILNGTLTPIGRVKFGSELDRLSDILFKQDWAAAVERLGEGNVTTSDLGRTLAQRRHDALVLMAESSAAAGKDPNMIKPQLYVHCTLADLEAAIEADAGGSPEAVPFEQSMCELEDHTQLSHRMLIRLAVQAEIRRVVFGPDGEVLNFGKKQRLFTPAQQDAMAVRDRVCLCGCGLSARRCEADHVTEVRDGGLTDLANGGPRCPSSHRKKTNLRTQRGSPNPPADETPLDPPEPTPRR
ncbi:MAG: hypothetical protein ACI8Y4_003954 [Candidatus Poriferisodalaceae bacterium]|jgi:hypothetical protein